MENNAGKTAYEKFLESQGKTLDGFKAVDIPKKAEKIIKFKLLTKYNDGLTMKERDYIKTLLNTSSHSFEKGTKTKEILERFIEGEIALQDIKIGFDNDDFIKSLKIVLRKYYDIIRSRKIMTDAEVREEVISATSYINNQIAKAIEEKKTKKATDDLINSLLG